METGTIVRTENDLAHVLVKAGDQCKSCGARVLCSPNASEERIIVAHNSIDASVDDNVVIEEIRALTLKLSFLQYGIPFLGFLFGLIIMFVLFPNPKLLPEEIIQFAGGIIGVLIGGWLARHSMKR